MKSGIICFLVALVGVCFMARGADVVQETMGMGKWQSLWDGKTFQGWHIIGSGKWTIKDGMIVTTHEAKDQEFGHLVTDATYRDFIVRLKYKAVKGNSGLYFRTEEKGYSGVSGFQGEIDAKSDAGGLYETNGRAWVVQPKPEDVKKWFKPGDWNEMVVMAVGRDVVVYVNGMKSAEVRNDPGRLEGKFALQTHAGLDCELYFKDIEIMPFESLTAGGDLSAFRKPTGDWTVVANVVQDSANEKTLLTDPGKGVIYNGPKGATQNLFTEAQFGDVVAHVEFLIPKGSNSGVYFQGRYEIQVYDSFGVQKGEYPGIECGGIYPRWIGGENKDGHSPRVNASLPAGKWQSFDIVFQAPRFGAEGGKSSHGKFVKVVHNGQVIHENVVVKGPTRAAAFEDEKALGPIMFQGDHGPVAYRNICILKAAK